MPIVELIKPPNKLLSTPCEPVNAADLKAGLFDAFVIRMKEAMKLHNGVGLAANQAGKPLALFIIDEKIAAEHDVGSVFANPEITEYGRDQEPLEEGCLSLPGFWAPVSRSKKIMFKALDAQGGRVKFRARGLLARVLQHETDHLNGLTIKDRLNSLHGPRH